MPAPALVRDLLGRLSASVPVPGPTPGARRSCAALGRDLLRRLHAVLAEREVPHLRDLSSGHPDGASAPVMGARALSSSTG